MRIRTDIRTDVSVQLNIRNATGLILRSARCNDRSAAANGAESSTKIGNTSRDGDNGDDVEVSVPRRHVGISVGSSTDLISTQLSIKYRHRH